MSLLETVSQTQFFWMCIVLYFIGLYIFQSFPLRLFAMILILAQALILNMKRNVNEMHPHCLRYHSEE